MSLLTRFQTTGSVYKEQLLSLIYPKICSHCERSLDPLSRIYLCSDCYSRINRYIKPPVCTICGKSIKIQDIHKKKRASVDILSDLCSDCTGCNFHFTRGHTAVLYEGLVKDCIHDFKYNSCTYLAGTLAQLMIDFAQNFMDMTEIDALASVPLHWRKLRQRGYNQAELLCKKLSSAFNIPIIYKGLGRIKDVLSQTELQRNERIDNVKDIFRVTKPHNFIGKRILLIDDVFTTGATLNECSKAIKEAGACKVEVFSLARSSY